LPFLRAVSAGLPIETEGGSGGGACGFLTLFVGPEGGWTDQEQALMESAGLTPARLSPTILRVETAAVAAAAVVACLQVELQARRAPDREERKPS
jgi:hypothetical protein